MKKLLLSGYIFAILASLGFSIKSVLVKLAYSYGTDAQTLMIMRVFLSLPFFLTALYFIEGKSGFTVDKKELPYFAFMGVIGIGLPILFAFLSIELIDASISALVVYAYPAITIILLAFFMGEKVTTRKVISIIITFLGLVFVLKVWALENGSINTTGVIYGLLAALFYSFYNLLGQNKIKSVAPIKVVTFCMVFVAIFFGIIIGVRDYPTEIEIWLIALTLAFASTFIPFVCYGYSIKYLGAGKTAILSSIGPVFTVIWAYFVLGETLDLPQVFGMTLIVVGIAALKTKTSKGAAAGRPSDISEELPLR